MLLSLFCPWKWGHMGKQIYICKLTYVILFQAMYSEFNAASVQIDKEFNAKLYDYGFSKCNLEDIVSLIIKLNKFYGLESGLCFMIRNFVVSAGLFV